MWAQSLRAISFRATYMYPRRSSRLRQAAPPAGRAGAPPHPPPRRATRALRQRRTRGWTTPHPTGARGPPRSTRWQNAHLTGRKRDKESAAVRGQGGGLPLGPQRPQQQHCQPPQQQQQQHQTPPQPQPGPSGTPKQSAGHWKPATFKLTPPSRHSKPGKAPKKEFEKKRQTRQAAKATKAESAATSGWEPDSSTRP